jgi:hypothetical protein
MGAPWTHHGGGGPPRLWEFEGHLNDHRWRPENVAFLEPTLTAATAEDALHRAAQRLANEPEGLIAALVVDDLPARAELLASRCAELPTLLATVQQSGTLLEWTR